jgi:hypothetical protein
MKKAEGQSSSVRAWARIPPSIKEILTQRAKDEGLSESAVIAKALTMYLTKDVTDESELIAKMSEIIRVVHNLSLSVEVGQKLDLDWMQYQFLFLPDLPDNEAERKARYKRAAQLTSNLIKSFRERSKRQPRLIETIFGSMLEEEEPAGDPK